jgi:DNA anti-recombination protein RmuC
MTRAEQAKWQARLDSVQDEADRFKERVRVLEAAFAQNSADLLRMNQLGNENRQMKADLAGLTQALENIAVMGAALARKVEGKG